jgi:REP element-mobilizing transposase RayT
MSKDVISYRFLPHFQPASAALFVTWRLAMTLPTYIVTRLGKAKQKDDQNLDNHTGKLKSFRQYHQSLNRFRLFDSLIDNLDTPRFLLTDETILPYITEPLHFINGKKVKLICYCVMPNHVHCVFVPLHKSSTEMYSLSEIMHSLKGYSAHRLTKEQNLEPPIWNSEYWDHAIRNDREFRQFVLYTLYNPVKAGLCRNWKDWKGNWAAEDLRVAIEAELQT